MLGFCCSITCTRLSTCTCPMPPLVSHRLPAPPPALPLTTPITSAITRLLGCNPGPFTLQGTNCYVISSPECSDAWLIDTGVGRPRFAQLLQQYLKTHNKQLCGIFITHRHDDHVGGLPSLCMGGSDVQVYKLLVAGESAVIPGGYWWVFIPQQCVSVALHNHYAC